MESTGSGSSKLIGQRAKTYAMSATSCCCCEYLELNLHCDVTCEAQKNCLLVYACVDAANRHVMRCLASPSLQQDAAAQHSPQWANSTEQQQWLQLWFISDPVYTLW
jgi:hypothetical protein